MGRRFAGVLVTSVLVMAMARVTAMPEQQKPAAIDYSTYTIKGTGSIDCGKFTDDLRTNRARWAEYYEDYVLGFLTGANYHSSLTQTGVPTVGKGVSPEALLAVLEQHCSAHPLNEVVDAAADLYVQLVKKEVQR